MKKQEAARATTPAAAKPNGDDQIIRLAHPHVNHLWHAVVSAALRICGQSDRITSVIVRVHMRALPWLSGCERGRR